MADAHQLDYNTKDKELLNNHITEEECHKGHPGHLKGKQILNHMHNKSRAILFA